MPALGTFVLGTDALVDHIRALEADSAPTIQTNLYLDEAGTPHDLVETFGGAIGYSVTQQVNELAAWSVALVDNSAEFDPAHPTSGWLNLLRPLPLPDANGLFQRKVVVQVKVADDPWVTLCSGPIQGRQQTGTEAQEEGWQHPIRGTDMGAKLTPGGKNLQYQRSIAGAPITNHSVLIQILTAAQLEMDLSRLSVMPMPEFNLGNESWLSAINRIMEACGGDWVIVGETFRAWDPVVKPKEEADWTYDQAIDEVAEVTVDESSATITNVISVVRSRNLDGDIARQTGSGIGVKNLTFSAPAHGWSVGQRTAIEGRLSDFWFLDALGNVIQVQDARGPLPPITGTPPAVSVEFTFGQELATDAGTYYAVEFLVKGADDVTLGDGFDDVMSHTFRYPDSISDYGEWPHEIYDPLLPNFDWMQNRADRFFAGNKGESERRTWSVRPLNPGLRVGDTVRLRHTETGEDIAVYVIEVTHQVGLDPYESRTTTFTGVQYR